MRSSRLVACAALLAIAASACKNSSTARGGLGRTGESSASGIQKVEKLVWKADLGATGAPFRVSGDLWVPAGKKIVQVEDAREASAVDLPSRPSSALTVESGDVYWGAGRKVWAASLDAGEKIWSAKASSTVRRTVAVTDDVVFASGGALHAFDRDTGEERWKFGGEGDIGGAPSFVGDDAFVVDSEGSMFAVDIATGQQVWAFTGPAPFADVSVAVDGEIAVAADLRGVVWAVFADRGREKWRFPTGGVVSSSVAIHSNRVFVGNELGVVVAINARTGQEIWRVDDLAAVVTAPVLAGGLVYVGCDDGRLIALSAEDGKVAWEFELEAEPIAAPTIGNGVVWAADHDGNVYELK
jgi:outer membrane protein assembly factor BamB